jgi:hypothetical protein
MQSISRYFVSSVISTFIFSNAYSDTYVDVSQLDVAGTYKGRITSNGVQPFIHGSPYGSTVMLMADVETPSETLSSQRLILKRDGSVLSFKRIPEYIVPSAQGGSGYGEAVVWRAVDDNGSAVGTFPVGATPQIKSVKYESSSDSFVELQGFNGTDIAFGHRVYATAMPGMDGKSGGFVVNADLCVDNSGGNNRQTLATIFKADGSVDSILGKLPMFLDESVCSTTNFLRSRVFAFSPNGENVMVIAGRSYDHYNQIFILGRSGNSWILKNFVHLDDIDLGAEHYSSYGAVLNDGRFAFNMFTGKAVRSFFHDGVGLVEIPSTNPGVCSINDARAMNGSQRVIVSQTCEEPQHMRAKFLVFSNALREFASVNVPRLFRDIPEGMISEFSTVWANGYMYDNYTHRMLVKVQ